MPNNIRSRQNSYVSNPIMGDNPNDFELFEAKTLMEEYGDKFIKAVARHAEQKRVVASGKLLGSMESIIDADGMGLSIMISDYFDYPNEGVKGWGSSRNAPSSPYQFKRKAKGGKPNYAAILNSGFGKSITEYIRSGRAKISSVQNDKARGIGLEGKKLNLEQQNALTLMALIKKFGIKRTQYFTDAVNEVFGKDFELKMTEAIGNDIIFSVEKINR